MLERERREYFDVAIVAMIDGHAEPADFSNQTQRLDGVTTDSRDRVIGALLCGGVAARTEPMCTPYGEAMDDAVFAHAWGRIGSLWIARSDCTDNHHRISSVSAKTRTSEITG
jgi:hypothetical protein